MKKKVDGDGDGDFGKKIIIGNSSQTLTSQTYERIYKIQTIIKKNCNFN